MADDKASSMSGLTQREAQEFHSLFMTSFIGFTLIAIVAHLLVWMWRPWLGPRADLSGSDAIQSIASVLNLLT